MKVPLELKPEGSEERATLLLGDERSGQEGSRFRGPGTRTCLRNLSALDGTVWARWEEEVRSDPEGHYRGF